MTTTDRARELAEEWRCRNSPCTGSDGIIHGTKAATEIAAILDLLVEARDWLDEEAPKALIEKIDKVLEGK